jgi:regulator of sigma E protease
MLAYLLFRRNAMPALVTFFTSSVFPMILSVGAVALLFGGTVMIHELGHFLTAKWFGLRIDAFSIGMGPAIWQKKIGDVVYKIGILPIGGYVALPQMDITGSAFENEDAKNGVLTEIAPWKRIVIAVAGPFMNVIAAFVLATIVWQVGKPADPGPGPAVVGRVEESSEAFKAGLREGDLIKQTNDDKIHFWADFQIAAMLNDRLNLKVIRGNELVNLYEIPTKINSYGYRELSGVAPVEDELLYIGVHEVTKDSPADKAGVLPGDRLVSIAGQEVSSGKIFVDAVQNSDGKPLELVLQAKGADTTRTVSLSANWHEEMKRWLIGISMQGEFEMVHPTPMSQIHYFQGSIFRTLKAFTRPREMRKAAGGVGGPVMILSGMHSQVKFHPMQALWFTALINVNLAIINLLPLIILDGGHIMVALFEIITGRKPYRRLIIAMANVMVVLLICIMVILSFRDLSLLKKLNTDPEPQAPAATAIPAGEQP